MKRATRAQRIEKLAVYLAWDAAWEHQSPRQVSAAAFWRTVSGTERKSWRIEAARRFEEFDRAGLVVRLRGER